MTGTQTLPQAVISAEALTVGARAALARGGSVADLRGDAYGHGAIEIAPVLRDAGIRTVLVDDRDTAEHLTGDGFHVVTGGEADLDSAVLYGWPGSGILPAMRLSAGIVSTKPLRAGEAVSYGYTHRAAVDTHVALVTGGYAQGIVRALGNSAGVEIAGALHPIVGRVAMDVCVVDLETTGEPYAEGTEVVYFGGAGPARENLAVWAEISGLTVPELIAVAGAKAVRTWTR